MFNFSKFIKDTKGATLVEFAFIGPLLVIICFALLDFVNLFFHYHRAGEATRLIARELAIRSPMVAQATMLANPKVDCSKITCNDMTAVITDAVKVLPELKTSNLHVTYAAHDIGNVGYSLAYKTLITVELTGLNYNFMMLGLVPGVPSQLPINPSSTTIIGNWY